MCEEIDRLFKEYNYKKIFFVTEDEGYLKYFKKNILKNLIFYNFSDQKIMIFFKIYPRKKHRYKLGKEIIVETLLLSRCTGILFTVSKYFIGCIDACKKRDTTS